MGDLKSIKAPPPSPPSRWPAVSRGPSSAAGAGAMAVIFLGVKNMIINNDASPPPLSLSHFFLCMYSEAVAVASLLPLSFVHDALPHPIDNGRWFASPLINSSIAIGINRLWIYLSPIYVIVVGSEGRREGKLEKMDNCHLWGSCRTCAYRSMQKNMEPTAPEPCPSLPCAPK